MGCERVSYISNGVRGLVGVALFMLLVATPIQSLAQQILTRIPLLPDAGVGWGSPFDTFLALDPPANRAYAIGGEESGNYLMQFDTATGALVALDPVSVTGTLAVLDVGVVSSEDVVLVAWGDVLSGGERRAPVILESFSTSSGRSLKQYPGLRFQAFDTEPGKSVVWGITTDPANKNYLITGLDVASGQWEDLPSGLAVENAIIRDVLLEPGKDSFLVLYQRTKVGSPNEVQPGAVVARYSVVDGKLLARGEVGDGYYFPGGMALDAQRGFLYLQSHLKSLYILRYADLTQVSAVPPKEIAVGYLPSGCVAVLPDSGDVVLGNSVEDPVGRRVLRVHIDTKGITELRAWSAGSNPTRLAYDRSLDRLLVLSSESNRLTLIDPNVDAAVSQVTTGFVPHSLIYSASTDEMLLETMEGDLYAVSLRDEILTDRLRDLGNRPVAGLHLDPQRRRVFAGTYGDSPPAILDLVTLTVRATLESPGGIIGFAPDSTILFQAGPSHTGQLNLYDAETTEFTGSVEDKTLLSGIRGLSIDVTRQLCYGASRDANGQLRSWAYNWGDGEVIEMAVPLDVAAGTPLNVQSDELSGNVFTAVLLGDTAYLVVHGGLFDKAPRVLDLKGATSVKDMVIDRANGKLLILTEDGFALTRQLQWLDLAKPGSVLSVPVNATSELMALDTLRSRLWVVTSEPPDLVSMPLPYDPLAGKPVESDATVTISTKAAPGAVLIEWKQGVSPVLPGMVMIFRQDGPLTDFRPILPAPLPAFATSYFDTDVIPAGSYRYRVEIQSAPPLRSDESTPVTPSRPGQRDTVARPLAGVIRVPRGGEGEFAIAVRGRFSPISKMDAVLPRAADLKRLGLLVAASPSSMTPPGVFRVKVTASSNAVPMTYPIPLDLEYRGESRTLWLFADVIVPFASGGVSRETLPGLSRAIQLHTDSNLEEGPGNRLVLKGRIGGLKGIGEETSVNVRIQTRLGGEIEQQGIPVSGGLFATSLTLGQTLRFGDEVRARVTWHGSRRGKGGTSPLLRLPVGSFSFPAIGKADETSTPEPAFLIVGATPSHADLPPKSGEMSELLDDAQVVMANDFNDSPAMVLKSNGAIGDAVNSSATPSFAFFYILGDTGTVPGSLRLEDGNYFTSEDLSEIAFSLPDTTLLALIEGPESGAFLDADYPDGMTLITSTTTSVNKMSPSDRSFSYAFYDDLKNGDVTVEEAWDRADLFVNPASSFGKAPQPSGYVRGDASDQVIRGRFVTGLVPDQIPPDILDVAVDSAGGIYSFAVLAQDDTDDPEALDVEAELVGVFGDDEVVSLAPAGATHAATVTWSAPPGFLLRVSARDSSENLSDVVEIWVGTTSSFFDINGDDKVNQADLAQWASLEGIPLDDWSFLLTSDWGLEKP